MPVISRLIINIDQLNEGLASLTDQKAHIV